MPAVRSSLTYSTAEPSNPGASGPPSSTSRLSIPIPTAPEMRCSTVWTSASPHMIAVRRGWATRFPAIAGIRGRPGRSVRTKTIPVSTGAGTKRTVAFSPVWRPTPVDSTARAIVRWGSLTLALLLLLAQLDPVRIVEEGEDVVRHVEPGREVEDGRDLGPEDPLLEALVAPALRVDLDDEI